MARAAKLCSFGETSPHLLFHVAMDCRFVSSCCNMSRTLKIALGWFLKLPLETVLWSTKYSKTACPVSWTRHYRWTPGTGQPLRSHMCLKRTWKWWSTQPSFIPPLRWTCDYFQLFELFRCRITLRTLMGLNICHGLGCEPFIQETR